MPMHYQLQRSRKFSLQNTFLKRCKSQKICSTAFLSFPGSIKTQVTLVNSLKRWMTSQCVNQNSHLLHVSGFFSPSPPKVQQIRIKWKLFINYCEFKDLSNCKWQIFKDTSEVWGLFIYCSSISTKNCQLTSKTKPVIKLWSTKDDCVSATAGSMAATSDT